MYTVRQAGCIQCCAILSPWNSFLRSALKACATGLIDDTTMSSERLSKSPQSMEIRAGGRRLS